MDSKFDLLEHSTDDIIVTVWCIAYNHEKYIKQTLEGFLMQKTNFRFEVLVHDDASTDATAKIIEDYAHNFPDLIKLILENENKKSKGINIGKEIMLPLSKGKFIAICEGDDFWIDDSKLQKQYDVMISNPNVSIVVGKVICCEEDGSPSNVIFPNEKLNLTKSGVIEKDRIGELTLTTYPFHTSSFFVTKTFQQKRLERNFTKYMNGDESYIREGLIEGDFYYINESISCRRLNSINNYNQRKLSWPFEKTINHALRFFYGEMLFDIQTNGEYFEILKKKATRISLCGLADKTIFNEIRKHYHIIAFDVLKELGFKNFFSYLMIRFFYKPYKKYMRSRYKCKQKI